jgi:hypothetical protein
MLVILSLNSLLMSKEMSDLLLFFIFAFVVVILIISLVYATRADKLIAEYKSDPNISSARKYLTWTVTIIWLLIAGIIFGMIALVITGPELIPTFGKTIIYLVLFIFVAAIIVTGIMASIAAYDIGQSNVSGDKLSAGYEDAIISAVTALGTLSLFVICYFVTWYHKKIPVNSFDYNSQYQAYSDYYNA